MGVINQERFTELFCSEQENPNLRRAVISAIGYSESEDEVGNQLQPWWNAPLNREAALSCYNAIRDHIRVAGYFNSKNLRPWEIDKQLYANLDRSQPWWGFEFETGYRSSQARARVVAHTWDTWDNMCFDAEGEGNAAVEITFAPQEMGKYLDNTASAVQFMQYLTDNSHLTLRTEEEMIGTHINLSVPGMTPKNVTPLTHGMQMSLAAIPQVIEGVGNTRLAMFGRSNLYNGFFGHTSDEAAWMEGKLFRTTYNMDEFRRYMDVCKAFTIALTKLVEVSESEEHKWHYELNHLPYVNNVYEIFAFGEAPQVLWADKSAVGTLTGSIQGRHGNTTWTNPTPQSREAYEQILREKEEEKRRKEEQERQKEVRKATAFTRLQERRALRAAGQRPDYVPVEGEQDNQSVWCDDCQDWHYDGDDSELFADPSELYAITE